MVIAGLSVRHCLGIVPFFDNMALKYVLERDLVLFRCRHLDRFKDFALLGRHTRRDVGLERTIAAIEKGKQDRSRYRRVRPKFI